ncbi:type IV secretory system conjugative DNA transfer family protein [Mycobacteroides abscessus]|uniref:type IV secretory system conjugative DNA transfer family protein n=1 Tax=Mycobacteroides abscessus TaxID=36809 RepID=UPI0009CFE1DB|nr:type IV secretory system conjugative DNA transfer family protein [Mycobacteroides abscessus]SLG17033.1 DNA segregation ATPase, FtsK/SpoIIIE family [Mycobacteroides abscessus subsp. abscessus]
MASSNRAARRAALARQQHARDEFMWRQDQRRAEAAHRDLLRDSDAADAERARTAERVKSILTKAHADAERAAGEVSKRFGAEERRLLGQPITRYTGATRTLSGGLVVWHWRAACPPALAARLGVQRNDAGPLAVLRPGGGLTETDSAPDVFAGLDASLLDDMEFLSWASTVAEIWHGDVTSRYQILGRLRDDTWFARLSESAGIADSAVDSETVTGRYGATERKATTVSIPSISSVEITQDGLEISFSHSPRASAKSWASHLDLLRNGFAAAGMNARNLRLSDRDGCVQMSFDDAPSAFPAAVAPPAVVVPQTVAEARHRYPELTWSLGVDARGNAIEPSVKNVFHSLVVGETGSGKSVYLAGLIEAWRPFARVFLADPKGSDYTALENAAGVVMRSEDPPQHVVLVGEVLRELNRRQRSAGLAKRDGNTDSAFDFIPVLLVLDEFTSLLLDIKSKFGDKGVRAFLEAVDKLMRKGRAFAIHVVIGSQDLYKDSIPVEIQGNAQLLVALGTTTDRTLMSKFIPDSLSEDAKRVGQRINSKQKGRALYVDTENNRVREVQTYYAWSPGTTTLEPNRKTSPPTEQVRVAWEAADQVCRSMPVLYPRLGIKVESPEWADMTVEELLNVPTIALDGAEGAIPERVKYDHRNSLDWVGAKAFEDIDAAPETLEEMVSTNTAPTPETTVTPPPPAPTDITEMTDSERREAVRREAVRLGLLPDAESVEPYEQAEENMAVKTPSAGGYSL